MVKKRFFIFTIFMILLSSIMFKEDGILVKADETSEVEFIHTSGRTSSLLLSKQGIVYGWGLWGEGSNVTLSKKMIIPTDISSNITLNENEEFIGIYSGEQHSLILTSAGRVFGFGSGEKRQLGYIDYLFKSNPTELTSMFPLNENEIIVDIACGDDFNVALTSDKRVLTWGLNEDGQLGVESDIEDSLVYDITDKFMLQDGDYIKKVSCGASHSVALSNNGYVYTWGSNKFNQLGRNDCYYLSTPTLIDNFNETVIKIETGRYTSYLLTNQNQLYGFGSDSYGQLATCKPILTSNKKETPYLMNGGFILENDEYIIDITAGYYYGFVKTNKNNYFSFGQNSSGQLANGSTLSTSIPQKINYQNLDNPLDEIVSISCGQDHCIATTKYNKILAWGSNLQNQLSEDSNVTQSFNKMIDITFNFPPIVLISTNAASIEYKQYIIDISAYYLDETKITETYYTISDSLTTPKDNWKLFDKTITLDESYEGKVYVHIKVDSEKGSYYHVSSVFLLDHISPTIKAINTENKEINNTCTNSTIFVEAIDNNSSVNIIYMYNGKQYSCESSTFSFVNDGMYKVYAVDAANNSSATIEFTIDTILPTITKIDNNLISSTSISTRERQITIQGSEALTCYLLGYKGVNQDSYIALNDNESTFTIKLKKGVNTLTIFDLAGNQSLTYEILYSPRFFQDTQLLLIVFGSLASIFILIIIFIYYIRNKRKLIK